MTYKQSSSQTATYKGTHKMNDNNTKKLTIYEGKTVHGIIRRNNGSQFLVERIDILRTCPTSEPNMPDLLTITHAENGTESYMPLYNNLGDPGYPSLVGHDNCHAIIKLYKENPNPPENSRHHDIDMEPTTPQSYSLDTFFPGYANSPTQVKEVDELHITVTIPDGATLRDLEEIYTFNIAVQRSDQAESDKSMPMMNPPAAANRYVSATLVIRGWDMTLDFHVD